MLRIPGSTLGADSWVTTFMRTVVAESNARRPGGEAVLERMSEMLFVEVLRRHIDSLPPEQTGWLAAMRDPAVGRALSLIHEKPAEAWTLERLSEAAGLSRSSLHERFVHFIGQPPMHYLTQWRMQVAVGPAPGHEREARGGGAGRRLRERGRVLPGVQARRRRVARVMAKGEAAGAGVIRSRVAPARGMRD